MSKIDGGRLHMKATAIIPPLVRRRPKNPTWKHTFNGSLLHTKEVDIIIDFARCSQYPFFTTGDGNVYITPKRGHWAEPVCRVEKLEVKSK
ncbi:MAG: hypothetical protein KBC02_01030 [Candidatus Pacebacteria bacterium]|nr:hypothetical protein [Candidatus Paceibacterota bacterium]